MERAGYTTKGERLRSGTFTIKNLTRRLLANAFVLYVKGAVNEGDAADLDESDDDDQDSTKAAKAEIPIVSGMRIPFVQISLFAPRAIPSVRTLSSPMLYLGAAGDLSFVDKKTDEPANPDSPVLTVSNLANIRLGSARKAGDSIEVPCWRPGRMKKYRLKGRLVGFESLRLLEIDSQDKISELAERLLEFSGD
ncbi:MAG: hypothetical protein AAF479_00240 [Pseudomonadota bacterium]